MESNKEMFNELAKDFLRIFNDWETEIYKKKVIEKYDNALFKQMCEEIIEDSDRKYFPRPIEFKRIAHSIKNRGYGF